MYIRSRIVISSAIVIMTASAGLAKDVSLPKIDLQKQCRTTQTATDELTGVKNPNAFDLCINSEQGARDKLLERWATIPAADKATCIHSTDWAPSYFEWLGCIDTRVYMRTTRKEHPNAMAPSVLCPKVNWQPDGSITSIVACK